MVNNNNPLLCVQVEGIKEIGDFITKIKRAGAGLVAAKVRRERALQVLVQREPHVEY